MADMPELGKLALNFPSWRWMPGMLGRRWAPGFSDHWTAPVRFDGRDEWAMESMVPDFSDPATRGCLLELVREKHGDPHIYVDCIVDDDGTVSWCAMGTSFSIGENAHPTEVEALVAALEAA